MTPNSNDIKQKFLGIITGEFPLDSIADFDVEISQKQDVMTLHSKLSDSLVVPTVTDMIRGFIAYENEPNKLKLWAFFNLSETGAIDFSKIEEHPFGERVIDALWEASDSGFVSEDFLNEARNFIK